MQNHSEIAEFLWKIADLVKDDYEAKDYEDVIRTNRRSVRAYSLHRQFQPLASVLFCGSSVLHPVGLRVFEMKG
jgi:hypothetical protein